MKTTLKQLSLCLASVGMLTIYGCGGGGGGTPAATPSTTLSGTVAGGAAVVGTVIVTDSKGATKGGTIEANGHYSIDVSGMTGPFMLKAAGTVGNTSVTYYSAATAADLGNTVNVTPFTDLIVSNIAGQLAENYFKDGAHSSDFGSLITPEKLAAAQTALHTKLLPVLQALGLSDSIDLLRTTFAADHSGMDAVLDLVKVETNTTTNIVTFKNALTNSVIATDDVNTSTDDATKVDNTKIAEITPTAATDLQTIVTKLNSFAALFATSLPSIDTLTNSGVFVTGPNFMMGGQTFAQFATEMSLQQSAVGLKFSNIDIKPVFDANNALISNVMILTAVISSNTETFNEKIRLKMVKSNGVWLVQGDGRIADISIRAQAQLNEWKTVDSNMATQNAGSATTNGLSIYIDPFSYNSSHVNAQAVTALITGPGLPSGGITMVQQNTDRWFKLPSLNYNTNIIPECVVSGPAQCVSIAQALDNSQYTVILKDINGNSLNNAGYTLTLPKQPYATSTLTTAMFPTITSITVGGQPLTFGALAANATVNVSWTMPSSLKAKYANIWANVANNSAFGRIEKDLASTSTSAVFGLGIQLTPGSITNAGVWLESVDAFGRRFARSQSVSLINTQ